MFSKSIGIGRKPKERRMSDRIREVQRIQLKASVRLSQNTVRSANVINMSSQGLLLEFSNIHCPPARVNEPISVKVHLSEDIVWLPGVVKHCYGPRMGVYFPDTRIQAMSPRFMLRRILHNIQQHKSTFLV